MKNYKILSKDMRAILGNGMKYEMNVTYEVSGELEPYANGFHYCKEIKDLFKSYKNENIKIFECEVDREVTNDGIKYCTNKIRLTRELSKEEIDQYFIDNLEELKNDEDCDVRAAVAKQGYALEELKNDEYWAVRRAVAQQGYALEELKNDRDWSVRLAVAEQGYALEELKNDEDRDVREEALKQIKIRNSLSISKKIQKYCTSWRYKKHYKRSVR